MVMALIGFSADVWCGEEERRVPPPPPAERQPDEEGRGARERGLGGEERGRAFGRERRGLGDMLGLRERPMERVAELGDLGFILASVNAVDRAQLAVACEMIRKEKKEDAERALKTILDKSPQAEAKGVATVLLGRLLRTMNKNAEADEILKLAGGRTEGLAARELLSPRLTSGNAEEGANILRAWLQAQKEPLVRCRILFSLTVMLEEGEALEAPAARETLTRILGGPADIATHEEALAVHEELREEAAALDAWRATRRRDRQENMLQRGVERMQMFGGMLERQGLPGGFGRPDARRGRPEGAPQGRGEQQEGPQALEPF